MARTKHGKTKKNRQLVLFRTWVLKTHPTRKQTCKLLPPHNCNKRQPQVFCLCFNFREMCFQKMPKSCVETFAPIVKIGQNLCKFSQELYGLEQTTKIYCKLLVLCILIFHNTLSCKLIRFFALTNKT